MHNIVVIGGGTSTATLLSGLKQEPSFSLTAIVPVTDSGGSSKIFLDALAHVKGEKKPGYQDVRIVPPGDVANVLVALSRHDDSIVSILNYRFAKLDTMFVGHSLRNIILGAAMEHLGMAGIERVSSLFNIRGRVIPVAPEAMHLSVTLADGTLLETYEASDPRNPKKTITLRGEEAIDYLPYQHTIHHPIVDIHLKPYGDTLPSVHPDAERAIAEADLIVFSPSDLWTSTVPILAVSGMAEALKASKARRCYFIPLTTKRLNTDRFVVRDFIHVLERYSFPGMVETVLLNTGTIRAEALQQEQCLQEEAAPVLLGDVSGLSANVIQTDLVNGHAAQSEQADIARSVIRHDPAKVLVLVKGLVTSREK